MYVTSFQFSIIKHGNILYNLSSPTHSSDIKQLTDLVISVVVTNKELQKQNLDLQKQLFEICKLNFVNSI